MKDYLTEIIIPYVKAQRDVMNEPDKSAVVIVDNCNGQVTPDIFQLLEANNIHLCLLPPNTTDRLQPMDVSVNCGIGSTRSSSKTLLTIFKTYPSLFCISNFSTATVEFLM